MPALDCELPILDIPLSSAVPSDNAVIMITEPDGTTTIRRWSVLKQALAPSDIEFQVGVTPGFPSDGDTTYTNAALIGKRVRVFRQHLKMTTIAVAGTYSYSFNNVTGTITPTPAFADEEIWSIEIY